MKRSILLAVLFAVLTFAISQVTTASSVSIDRVNGEWEPGKVGPGEDFSFDIRLTNTHTDKIGGFKTGLRVWTNYGTFTPPTVEILHPDFESFFDLAHRIYFFGPNSDTVGIGGAIISGPGIPVGFDDVVYRIHTGGIDSGATLCIDSSYFPPSGTWKWASGSYNIFPDWSGVRCVKAVCPDCMPPLFIDPPYSLTNTNCDNISYTYIAEKLGSVGPPPYIRYFMVDGPGVIDSITGDWSYSIAPEDLGTYDTLIIGTYDLASCKCNTSTSRTILQFLTEIPVDFNEDCSADISDLVLVVQYMFGGGVAPTPLLSADMNADAQIDVSDLVWIVNYMFNGGPPPLE